MLIAQGYFAVKGTSLVIQKQRFSLICQLPSEHRPVILLPAHLASFAHNFVSGLQIYFFSESQDAIVLNS